MKKHAPKLATIAGLGLIFLLLVWNALHRLTFTGKVVVVKGLPIPGASVTLEVKGDEWGTRHYERIVKFITDSNGSFLYRGPSCFSLTAVVQKEGYASSMGGTLADFYLTRSVKPMSGSPTPVIFHLTQRGSAASGAPAK